MGVAEQIVNEMGLIEFGRKLEGKTERYGDDTVYTRRRVEKMTHKLWLTMGFEPSGVSDIWVNPKLGVSLPYDSFVAVVIVEMLLAWRK